MAVWVKIRILFYTKIQGGFSMKIKIREGVTLNFIQSDKFKDIAVHINFLQDLNAKDATARSVLSMMMTDRCEKYDTKQKMSNVCDELYGATLSCRTIGCGGGHVVEFRSKIINPIYVEGSANLLRDQLCLIKEIIFNPYYENGHFNKEIFDEAVRLLKSKIMRRLDDAQTYSLLLAFQNAGKNQPLSISALGSMDILEALTIEEIEQQYHRMLDNDQVEIIVCGQFDEIQIGHMIESIFDFPMRSGKACTHYCLNSEPNNEIIRVEKDIPQTNIAMIWKSGIDVVDEQYAALRVANGIFGQYSTSYLFQEVREKNSLCYSIFSNLISFDGALVVSTGIEHQNIDKTIKLIKEQFNRCQNGDFSDELIDVTKKMIVNSLKTSRDDMNSIISYAYNNSLLERELTIEENIDRISNVSKESIVEAFNSCELLTTVVLTGKE